MISIVICSLHEGQFNRLQDNILSTIGNVQFELLRIDNGKNTYTIAEAYNEGISKAQYPYLVFVHEDVLFHTEAWGKKLLEYFENDQRIGLIGLAGSKIKTSIPSSWWENEKENQVMNIIQHYPNGKKERILFGFTEKPLTEVILIDGVFIAMRKTKLNFDERLKGFHNYDQSISLKNRKAGYKNFVTNEIVIEHYSIGNKDRCWLKSNIELSKLYQKDLPQTLRGKKVTKSQRAYSYLRLYKNYRGVGDKRNAIKTFFKFLYNSSISKKNLGILRELLIWSVKN